MHGLAIVLQLVVAVGIFNVWVVRHDKPTPWRPSGAGNMEEEFARYGLPDWARRVIGSAKLLLAALLVAGIWYPPVAELAAFALSALMLGAVLAHARIRDPLRKAVPALAMLALCLLVGLITGQA
jgi:hypothetical protein